MSHVPLSTMVLSVTKFETFLSITYLLTMTVSMIPIKVHNSRQLSIAPMCWQSVSLNESIYSTIASYVNKSMTTILTIIVPKHDPANGQKEEARLSFCWNFSEIILPGKLKLMMSHCTDRARTAQSLLHCCIHNQFRFLLTPPSYVGSWPALKPIPAETHATQGLLGFLNLFHWKIYDPPLSSLAGSLTTVTRLEAR